MKIVLFGASGRIGQRIAQEALDRGHSVTAVARHTETLALQHERLTVTPGDARDADEVARLAAGHDIVASAIGPSGGEERAMLSEAAHALIAGTKRAGDPRLIVVGGAGSLEVAPGELLLDSPSFNPAWRPGALAHRDALEVYRAEQALDWTYLSPADQITPGERTGHYRTGGDQLVRDANGESRISMEDFAVAFLDEIESPRFPRQRFTVAY
ncbi:MAG TPA: NAD(P)-dependent oxidoreductase [Ktedonobacterales bacterium]|jgi:putative NADH-flavin reductase|nr:NAD(P)-dependent oxidoreductase [Ktedonobacterales bacterium]